MLLKKSDMEQQIIIIGAVGTARNIIEQVNDAALNYNYPFKIKGVLIDSFDRGAKIAGVEVIGTTHDISEYIKESNNKFLFCLHKPECLDERYRLLQSYRIPNNRFTNFIHPLSYIANSVDIGNGNIILSNTTVQSDVKLGNFNIINSNVTIEHETKLGNFNFIAANACLGANVRIGNTNFIGLNTSVRENIIIGNDVYAGMHSLILDNFSNCRVYGIPAKSQKD